MPPLISVNRLVKNYRLGGKSIEVLQGIDLSIEAGEKVSITGRSGVGKSTLLHILGTLDRPTAGNVLFDDIDVFKLKEKALALSLIHI